MKNFHAIEENAGPLMFAQFRWQLTFPWPSTRGAHVTSRWLSQSKMSTNPPEDGKSQVYGKCSLCLVTYAGLLNRHDLQNMSGTLTKREVVGTLRALCHHLKPHHFGQ